jgi:hypothetical protein
MHRVSIIGALLAFGLAAQSAAPAQPPPVDCDKVILTVPSGTSGGYRVVLGAVSVPEAYHRQIVRTRNKAWPYWRKAGLVIRGGSPPVSVTVPRAWRARVRVTWGKQAGSEIRFATCPAYDASEPWNAYAGGFELRVRAACVPLIVRTAGRSAIVRFGLARRCR